MGTSVIFSEKNNEYSEALAGSGEVAVFSLVEKVVKCEPGTLILLDEPEVSLHPGAQKKLRDFLFEEIKTKRHQVVITTHSPTMVDYLPPTAIKVIDNSLPDGMFNIIDESIPTQAFSRLGFDSAKKQIIVEDVLAKLFVERAIEYIDPALKDNIVVSVHPGGGEQIKINWIHTLSVSNLDVVVLLDGDQKLRDDFININKIPPDDLEKEFNSYVGVNVDKIIPKEGSSGKSNKKNRKEFVVKSFEAYKNNFFFFNRDTPEHLLYEMENNSPYTGCIKGYYRDEAKESIGSNPSSEEILTFQKIKLNSCIKKDGSHPAWKQFVDVVRDII